MLTIARNLAKAYHNSKTLLQISTSNYGVGMVKAGANWLTVLASIDNNYRRQITEENYCYRS